MAKGACKLCQNLKVIPLIKGLCQYHYWSEKRSKSSPIKPIANKRAKQINEYSKTKKELFKDSPICAAAHLMRPDCTRFATDINHLKGRENDLLTDISNFNYLCRNCHRFFTDNTKLGIELCIMKKRNTKYKSNK